MLTTSWENASKSKKEEGERKRYLMPCNLKGRAQERRRFQRQRKGAEKKMVG